MRIAIEIAAFLPTWATWAARIAAVLATFAVASAAEDMIRNARPKRK